MVVALGVCLALNISLTVALVLVVKENRAVTSEAMEKTRDAMDAILAATNLPAAAFCDTVRDRSLKKANSEPVEREREVWN